MAATTPPQTPPKAHWHWAEPPAAPSPPARSTGGQGAAPTAPHGLLGAQRRGRHGCSAQTSEDGTVALPRSEAMMQKPPEPCQE